MDATILTVVLVVGIAFLIFLLSTTPSAIEQRYGTQRGAPRHSGDSANKNGRDIDPNALVAAIEAYHQQRNAHEYKRAQREQTTIIVLSLTGAFALLAAGATIATVIVTHEDTRWSADQQHADTMAALGKTDATIAALTGQTNIMRGQLEEMRVARRPWLTMDAAVAEDLDYDVNGVHLGFDFTFRNTGNTPATNAFVNLEAFAMIPKNVNQERERVCSQLLNSGVDVFPGDKLSP